MPTPFTHAIIPLALGHTVTDKKLPVRFWILAVLCSVLPDLDVIGFRFGVSYGDFFGHRGFFHSLFFAFLLSSAAMLLAFRKPTVFSKKWWLMWLFLFGVSSSHGILDAFTDGGLGIALLSPFDTTRYFSPWRPLAVSPIGIRAFFIYWRKEVLLTELFWVWLPLAFAFIIVKAYRRIKLMKCDKTRKAECQSVELAKNIFKRLFLALLVLLLIAGLVFQAPRKINTLLLIVLAACTVLPKPYRKWFWLSAAAVVLVLIIWVFLPEDNEGWRPYTFDEELATLEAKYAIPDSENAATIYNNLLEDYDSNTMHPDFLDSNIENLTLRAPWSSKDYPELAKWIEDQQNTIAKLSEASKIAKCAFPILHDTFSLSDTMHYLPEIRGWAFLLVRAGNNDMAEGRIEEGLQKYLCVGKMGDHMRQQSTIIEMLVGIAVEALALGRFKTFVVTADATEAHLSVIEEALADIKHDWSSDWPRILECEKIISKNEFAKYYDVNPKGKIRLSRDPLAKIRTCWKEQLEANQIENRQIKEILESRVYLNYWQKKLIKARTILYWFYIPSSPQGAFKLIDTCFEKYYAMAEPEFDWQKEPKKSSLISLKLNYRFIFQSLGYMSETIYYRFHDIYLRADAEKRGTLLIIALRLYKNEYGQWPQRLDEVKGLADAEVFVDPISGDSFVYKLSEENFTLYSKGKNKVDEGGKRDKGSGADDWLIWPPKSRKTKKVKADSE